MKNLYLIDGHALIFRMYYAFLRRPMINSKGEDTSILFGFTKYLLELIAREQPTHLAVMFDPPGGTFRNELYPEYKATRTATPELVKAALEPLTEIVRALDIPVLMKPGFEADDVIGTLARRFAGDDCDVFMVTPDKDLGQIIDTHVFQYKPGKGGSENEIIGREAVCAQYGIRDPLQIIDILAIWGDAADNVKGVAGVGEVGARKLVSTYGSLEGIIDHLDELPPRQQAAFREALPHLSLSKTLVTVKTDVDIDVTPEALELGRPDAQRVGNLFDHYEFNSLRGLVPDLGNTPQPRKQEPLSAVPAPAEEIIAQARREGRVAVRLSDRVILSCGNRYCTLDYPAAAPLLRDESVTKCGIGLKHTALRGPLHDVEIMHYLLNPERSHKLDTLAAAYLDADLSQSEADGQMMLFSFDDTAAGKECVAAGLIAPLLQKELEEQHLWDLYTRIEMPLIGILADMEATGVKIDPVMLGAYGRELSKELSRIEQEARDLAGDSTLNLSSPKQIGVVLYEKLDLNPRAKKTKGGSYPTDEETLSEIADRHPIVGKILEFRAVKKLLSTYIEPLPAQADRTGKVHTTFTQALTATGRLSSLRPNLQNIPIRTERGMKIREAFVPSDPEGWIVSADYSQIELRLMAHLSADPHLVAGFAHGADVHRATAARIFHVDPEQVTAEQRRHAKVANFGIIYGISAFGLSQRMGISRSEARAFIEEYFRSYPGVRDYMDRVIAQAREQGYVETLFGRKRYLPDINSKNAVARGLAERNAINAPIQGGAADIIKLAMIAVSRRLAAEGLRSKMVLQVHDELVFDVVPDERNRILELVKQEMESVCTLSVPLITECNYGKNWREAH